MQQAGCLEGGPLLWIWPLYLHVNKKSDDDDNDVCVNLSGLVMAIACTFMHGFQNNLTHLFSLRRRSDI